MNQPKAPLINRLMQSAFFLCSMFLVFIVGAVATEMRWPIASWARDAFMAARALTSQHMLDEDDHPKLLWNAARTDVKGVGQHDETLSSGGYTLYSAADAGRAILVDESGEEVHAWDIPFSKVCPDASILNWVSDRSILMRRTELFPDGDLIALYDTPAFTPSGCGIVRVNHEGEVIWSWDGHAHHDFALDSDGNTWVLTNGIRRTAHDEWLQIDTPFIEEFVTQLDDSGKLVKNLSLFDLIGKSPFYYPQISFGDQRGDVLHSNTVNVVNESFASHHASVSAGDLMVCLRNLNLVIVINPNDEKIVWSATGPWNRPHDPDPLDNGNVLIFDNCYISGTVQGSRVVEVDTANSAVAWAFAGEGKQRLYSEIRSSQELLSNGNVLITESNFGRILEVTRSGNVAWEFVHPVRAQGDGLEIIPVVCGARRYESQQLSFLSHRPKAVVASK